MVEDNRTADTPHSHKESITQSGGETVEAREYKQPRTSVLAQDVSITYSVQLTPKQSRHRSIKSRLLPVRSRSEKVEAVRGVTLEVLEGESVGLLGLNGSGKSSFLRALAGLEPITSGQILARSQPVLLGVGAALESNLSGFENITLGCLAMGLTPSRIDQVADEVAEFIDIGDALYAPMKTYSAGMKARLRFAIAASARPDILLIDEALATGDASFRAKSVAKTKELTEHAGTLFLVSHSASNILEMCDRGVWLSKGEKVMDGEVREVVRQYRTWVKLRTEKKFEQADAMLVELAGSARQ